MKDEIQEAATPPHDDLVAPPRIPEGAHPGPDEPRAGMMHRPERKGAVERLFSSRRPPTPAPLPGTTLKTVGRRRDRRHFWLWGLRYCFQLPARPPGVAPVRIVQSRFDPQDLGTVWVQAPATGRFVEARQRDAARRAGTDRSADARPVTAGPGGKSAAAPETRDSA